MKLGLIFTLPIIWTLDLSHLCQAAPVQTTLRTKSECSEELSWTLLIPMLHLTKLPFSLIQAADINLAVTLWERPFLKFLFRLQEFL